MIFICPGLGGCATGKFTTKVVNMGKAARQANRRARRAAGVVVPKVVRRSKVDEGSVQRTVPADAFDELVKRRERLADAELEIIFWVAQARAAGVTWQRVGDALGISQQAACKRFGRPPAKGVRASRMYTGL